MRVNDGIVESVQLQRDVELLVEAPSGAHN